MSKEAKKSLFETLPPETLPSLSCRRRCELIGLAKPLARLVCLISSVTRSIPQVH